MRRRWMPGVMLVAAMACGDADEVEMEIGDDTLRMEVPEDASRRLERTGRQIGGRVGETLEETGQAIEEAGRRIQEEAADTLDR